MTQKPTQTINHVAESQAFAKRIANANKLRKIFPYAPQGLNKVAENDNLTYKVIERFEEIVNALPGTQEEREKRAVEIIRTLVDLRKGEEKDISERIKEAAILMKGGIEIIKEALTRMDRADIAQIIGFTPPETQEGIDSKTTDIMDRTINRFLKDKDRLNEILRGILELKKEEEIDLTEVEKLILEQAHVSNYFNRKSQVMDSIIERIGNLRSKEDRKKLPGTKVVLNVLFDHYIFPRKSAA